MASYNAATLAWRLSEQHEAEYGAIRHPGGKHTIATVRRQTLQAVSATRWQRRHARMVAQLVLPIPAAHRFATRFLMRLTEPEWL